jgi:hypothetical protein
MAVDPLDPTLLRRQNRQQLLSDVLRNARGAPEAALTMGTALADMAGTGLGTLAGMAKQKLSGEDVDLGAATDTLQEGKFTYAPRSEGGKETLRGLETVTAPIEQGMQYAGQKTADVTGSPAAGAAAYTALNVLDPQMLAPAAAKVAALRGASRVARGATFDPVSNTGMGGRQRGAWSPGDIADTEGDFTMRSTVEDALGKLKPQEQRARGKQMLQVLKKYGAKEEDLRWSGLNDALASDVPVTADEIRQHMTDYGVQVEPKRRGASSPEVEKGEEAIDPDEMREKIDELVREDSDLEYPQQYHVRNTDYGNDIIESFASEREAERFIERYRNDYAENEVDYYLTERGAEDVDNWDEMSDAEKQSWAEEQARESADNLSLEMEAESDYDADPSNYDDLYEYWQREVERDPGNYGLSGGGSGEAAKWSEYTIEGPGGQKGSNYGETIMALKREGRYGRGIPMDTTNTPANLEQMSPFQRARYDALKAAKTDPLSQQAAKDYRYTTHFPETNPLVYTRESDMPKPPEFDTEGSMRVVEELQSDWGQQGRKKGILDVDTERAAADKRAERVRVEGTDNINQSLALFERMSPQDQALVATRYGAPNAETVRMLATEAINSGNAAQMLTFAENFANHIYYTSSVPDIENAAIQIRRGAERLYRNDQSEKLPPAPFIGDAKKFAQLGLQQAIADAVRRGDQYVGVSPGYVHAPERWGSEDLSWWTDQQANAPDPNQMDMISGETPAPVPTKRKVAAKSGDYDKTRGEKWKATVAALRRGEDLGDSYSSPTVAEIDTASPEAEAQMEDIIRQKLSYESSQYADPEAFIKARAAKVLESMRKEQEGQYSPRAHGMNEFYDKIATGALEKILKESGSTGSGKGVKRFAEAPLGTAYAMVFDQTMNEWRPRELNSASEIAQYRELAATQPNKYRFEPPRMHVVEIDPELARAAKRGFKLPF